jgi:nitrogen fixation/metabolism regulation signal transduction histidine kinase
MLSTWGSAEKTLHAVIDGVRNLRHGDFGLRLARTRDDELGELADLHNEVGDLLRVERTEIYQRELLLDTLLQGAPMAILLVNELDRIAYANAAARRLLSPSRRLVGRTLAEAAAEAPEEMATALRASGDSLVTCALPSPGSGTVEETFRILRREFQLNTQRQLLVVVERITPELRRQEVEVWKKVIRLMSHELNNSVAPISSLLHSARTVAGRPDSGARLDDILSTIEERVRHLSSFLEGYARFARLPRPSREEVSWRGLLDRVAPLYTFRLEGTLPHTPARVDPSQMEQVLINLLKNAVESGSPPDDIAVAVDAVPSGGTVLRVLDRGPGMDEETLQKALLPFYSSKPAGSGLGLALSAEIVTAHGGRMTLRNRPGGGLEVTCWLPPG